jgi:hypothetical protein
METGGGLESGCCKPARRDTGCVVQRADELAQAATSPHARSRSGSIYWYVYFLVPYTCRAYFSRRIAFNQC